MTTMRSRSSVKAQRRPDIEALRLVCAFGIVWFHSEGPYAQVAYAGLMIFGALSAYFSVQTSSGTSDRREATWILRLIRPWLFWFLVYLLVDLRKGVLPPVTLSGTMWLVLAGSSIHLWYIPYVVCTSLLIRALTRLPGSPGLKMLATAGVAALLAALSVRHEQSLQLPGPLPQYLHVLPATLLGLSLGLLREHRPAMPALWVTGLALVAAIADPLGRWFNAYSVGFLVLGAVLLFPLRWNHPPQWLYELSSLTLGIYFVHILVLRLAFKMMLPTPWLQLSAFLMSAGIVLAIRRLPLSISRWMV